MTTEAKMSSPEKQRGRGAEPADVQADVQENEASNPNDITCGIGSWRPDWLQTYATPKVFVINFSLMAIVQSAYFTYLVGSMSTLEKRFAFDSRITGFILIADNLSSMIISPIVGYLGDHWNRPRLIAFSELLVVLSCFLTALPYFIYGPGLHLLTDSNLPKSTMANATNYEICDAFDKETGCDQESHSTVVTAVVLIWIGSFINGAGNTAFYTVGMPYLDDNVKKKNSPIYLSWVSTIRLLGPSLGFLISSVCLRWYEDPFYTPDITRRDPRWVGAWWIGFVIIGLVILVCTLPFFLFPAQLNAATQKRRSSIMFKSKSIQIKEAMASVKRLLKNPVYVFHAVGAVFRIVGYLGYYIFQPKYMEAHFRKTASEASLFSGVANIFMMALGIMIGGVYISRAKPGGRKLVSFMFIVEIVSGCALFVVMFLGCQGPSFGHDMNPEGTNFMLDASCNQGCGCTQRIYQPSCSDGMTYFSPCYAGCTQVNGTSNTTMTFDSCACLDGGSLDKGFCSDDSCDYFKYYIVILAVGAFISSMSRTGNSLITLRAVEPRDKSFAMGIIGTFLNVFAFIPYPLIFGAITDSTCVIWEEACGKRGNCWVYDLDKFRYYLHGTSFAFMTIGSLFDIVVLIYADRMKNIYDDEEEDDEGGKTEADKATQIQLKSLKERKESRDEDVIFNRSSSKVSSFD